MEKPSFAMDNNTLLEDIWYMFLSQEELLQMTQF